VAGTRPTQRIIALVLAIVFFGVSFAASFAVIAQVVQDNKDQKTVEDDKTTQLNTSNSNQSQAKLEGTKLQNFTPVESVDKLQVIDTKVGDGQEAKAGETVTVDYTGAVAATGVIFQSSLDTGQPVPLSLSQVIKGWEEGIPGMKIGGQRRLVIPAEKAYGGNPPEGSGIPANAPLVFDITLHAIGD
jgi:FKBP-type peptidyl-prolyl cis-trans isomerase